MSILNNEEREFLNILRERNAYRDTLVEIMHEQLPKLLEIQTRLHSGSDAMRDEGHKLWLICTYLSMLKGEK
jgi:hypothetical protein